MDVAPGEPFPAPRGEGEGLLAHLLQAATWAEELGMAVVVDLHGAPGSQNGFDNSGRRGKVRWLEEGHVERTLRVIGMFASVLAGWVDRGLLRQETIHGFAVLNEPWGVDTAVWEELRESFYPQAYEVSLRPAHGAGGAGHARRPGLGGGPPAVLPPLV